MKSFRCDHCGMMVFFQNDHCVKCDHLLGFLPDVLDLCALDPSSENKWRPSAPRAGSKNYRHCSNRSQFHACNWLVPEDDSNLFCIACRVNVIIPDLKEPKNLERWIKLELAKRRCFYTFLKLRLPIESSGAGKGAPLRFKFLQDDVKSPVKTGHENGTITVNVSEADDDERERRRLQLHEPYRTLVGHLRHESGHYYWDRLIAGSANLKGFRELFGDETADYTASLQAYYEQGAPAGWQGRTVTAYASSHPWEDWAETWAHYLHIMDAMETAASFGLSVNPDNAANQSPQNASPIFFGVQMDFDTILGGWIPLTCALNSINRGMGLPDLYPFVIPPAVVEKLRFIHQVINLEPLNSTFQKSSSGWT